jgi:hypothetical protein
MTRPHVRRSAAAALTLGTTAATLLLGAPTALAADLAAPTVSASTAVPGQPFTVSGLGCVKTPGGTAPTVYIDSPAALRTAAPAAADGSWSLKATFPAGTPDGAYTISVFCDDYMGERTYAPVTVTIGTAAATPAPAPKPLATGDRTTFNKITAGTPFTLGERFKASYPGFKPFEVVTLVLHSTPQNVGTFTADANGVVTVNFTIPAGTAGGSHSLTMSGNLGTSFAQALKVASSRSLAYTGADVAAPLAIGGSLLLVGGALMVAARRRSAGAPQA